MKVFIAGATGVLGRRLVRQFCERGDEVLALVRSPEREALVRSLGGEPRRADLFDAESLARVAQGAEVVIHAATAIPTTAQAIADDWAMNDRIRRDGTRALLECSRKIGARRFLFQSIVWVVRPKDQSEFDETSPCVPHPLYDSATDGEKLALEAAGGGALDVSILRCGSFYAADAAHARTFAELVKQHKLPIPGKGEAVWAIIHADDAAAAHVTAAHAPRTGLWHVVDDVPVTVGEFFAELATRLEAPPPLHLAEWMIRMAAGATVIEFLTTSTRTSNRRLRTELGWTPRYPSFREGLDQVVSEWRAEGFPGE